MFLPTLGKATSDLTAFQGGVLPGIPSSHIGLGKGILRFSGIATPGGSFIDLSSGKQATTINSTVTGIVDGTIGPSCKFPNTFSGLGFSTFPSITDSTKTLAAIIRFTSNGVIQEIIAENPNFNTGWGFFIRTNNTVSSCCGAAGTTTTLTLTSGVPYFIIVSSNTVTQNYLIKRLDTGSVQTLTASAAQTPNATTGPVAVGNIYTTGSRNVPGPIASVMSSTQYMTLPMMIQWAENPWSFWYPTRLNIPSSTGIVISSGITGTLSVTEDNDTLSSTASSTISATLSVTEDSDTLSSTASLNITSTLSVTEDPDVLTSTGTVGSGISGSLTITEQNDTLTSSSSVSISGTLTVTEQNDSLTSSGTTGSITCSLTITEQNDTLSSSVDTGGVITVVGGGRWREEIEKNWTINYPDPMKVSDVRTSASRLGRIGGIASGISRNKK